MERVEKISLTKLKRLFEALYHGESLVCEAYSAFDHSIQKFKSASALENYAQTEREAGKDFLNLVAHFPEAKGQVEVRRISLKPEKCNGASWRESVEGWGVIQLQVKHLDSGTAEVRIAVNTEKRAAAWALTYPEMGSPSLWDWQHVEKQARRLIRILRSDA